MSVNASDSQLASRYQLRELIGKGGAGEVFGGWDTKLQRSVAIKRLRADADEATVQNLWKEATRLAAVGHPNIVSIYDMGLDNGLPYIVMERLDGDTVDKRVLRGKMDLEEFTSFAQQSLEALIAAHHAGLIHRDLKPSNVMLSKLPSGSLKVKVLDFGIAKFLEAPSEQTMHLDGTITGSIHCIAPEQLNRDPVDERSDLYSMGCVYYYALAGEYPFSGDRFADIISAHLNHLVADLRNRRADLPPLVCDWVMGLINRSPNQRYQSAAEALEAFRNVLGQTATAAIPLPPVQPPAPTTVVAHAPVETARRKYVAMAAVFLASAALAGVAFYLFGGAGKKGGAGGQVGQSSPREIAAVAAVAASKPPAAPAAKAQSTTPVPVPKVPEPAPVAPAPVVAEAAAPVAIPEMPPEKPAVAEKPAEVAEVVLRIAGSNTIGATLLPALMERFLEREGATSVSRVPGKTAEELTLNVRFEGQPKLQAMEIMAHGSSTAFSELQSGKSEIGMSSRPIKPEEVESLARAGLEQMDSPASEHVLGLDGLAIIVHESNPIRELTKTQVADIFAGRTTDWAQIGGKAGPVHLYARDAKSGTFDTFKSLVLGSAPMGGGAKRFEDSAALSDAVAADPGGIGFIGLPYVRKSKLLAISESGTTPLLATRFTVATEDYVLSRRLYLYTPSRSRNPMVAKFVEFALSPEGQEIVHKVGFVKQTIDFETPVIAPGAPADYLKTIRDAERLSLNFRFQKGQTQLDTKALRDLDRIAALAAEPRMRGRKLVLLGFTDGKGASSVNLRLSKERARIVADELTKRGVSAQVVAGFGSALPVASNDSDAGRDKNRRVEVWLGGSTQTARN